MIVVQDGNNIFSAEDFYYNNKECYIKIFYRGDKHRLIQGVKCMFSYDSGVIKIDLHKAGEDEKT